MAVNNLDFNQAATLLSNILYYAQGRTGTVPTVPASEQEFVSVGQMALKTGYDKLATAISQVLSETIFSVRPYSRKFKDLNVSEQMYGAITRKLAVVDKPFEADQKFDLVDGQSVDHYEVKKPLVLQLNFYGANEFQDHVTIYTEQLDMSMTGSAQFSQFITMVMQNMSDKIEQAHEELARNAMNVMIADSIWLSEAQGGNSPYVQKVNLIAEYNQLTGQSLTATTVFQPANFPSFIKFCSARIASISDMMTSRSLLFHQNVTGKELMKHTPKADQRLYMVSDFLNKIKAMALSDIFHENMADITAEPIDYWYDIKNPYNIKLDGACCLQADGTLTNLVADEQFQFDGKVVGVVFDRDAVGYTTVKHTVSTTPLNSAGLYFNTYYHFTDKYWVANEENCVVFLLA